MCVACDEHPWALEISIYVFQIQGWARVNMVARCLFLVGIPFGEFMFVSYWQLPGSCKRTKHLWTQKNMDFKDVTSTMGKQGEDKQENVCSQKPRSVSPSQNPGHPKKCIHKKRVVKRFWREYETLVPFGKPTQQKKIYCFQMHSLQKNGICRSHCLLTRV